MKFWRKILTLGGIVISLAGNVVSTAKAAEPQQEPVCVQYKEYDYVTDIKDLVSLAQSQKVTARNASLGEDASVLEIDQLISEKYFSDGSTEKEHAKSTITLMESRASNNTSTSKTWGKYDIACVVTAYYTEYYGAGTETGIVLQYTAFSFNDAETNSVTVRKVDMYSHCIYDPASADSVERYATYNYPSSGKVYTLNSDDSRIYGGGGFQQMYCGAIVTLSDGSTSGEYNLQIILR